jgi:hypothetical protein
MLGMEHQPPRQKYFETIPKNFMRAEEIIGTTKLASKNTKNNCFVHGDPYPAMTEKFDLSFIPKNGNDAVART